MNEKKAALSAIIQKYTPHLMEKEIPFNMLKGTAVVLPAHLLETYREKHLYINCTVHTLFQLTLAKYIKSGKYQRHINAMKTHYRKKHDYIGNFVKESLTEKAVLIGKNASFNG